jgi:hypothetical protein
MRPDPSRSARFSRVFRFAFPPPSSHPSASSLRAYRDNELNKEDSRIIAEHLELCAACHTASELERRQIDRVLSEQAREPLPEALAERRDELQSLLRSLRLSKPAVTQSLLALLSGRKAASNQNTYASNDRSPTPLTAGILAATGFHLLVGIIACCVWQISGDPKWVRQFFNSAGDLFLLEMAAATFYVSFRASMGFTRGEPLYQGWYLVTTSFACGAVGYIFSKLLATHPNPLWSSVRPQDLHQFGLLLGGPLEFVLLGCGMFSVLRAYHRAGIMTHVLSTGEYVLLACTAAYTLCESTQVVMSIRAGVPWSLQDCIKATNDPLLLVLLGAALVLRRSVYNFGDKGFSRCWTAMVCAISFVFAGNMIDWATAYQYLPHQMTWIGWHVWFVSSASYALGCAFQLQAMGRASECLVGPKPAAATAGRRIASN